MLEPLFSDHRSIVQDFLAFSLCIAAFIWGGGPEKAVAATWLLLFEIATQIRRAVFGEGYRLFDVDPFLASTDLVACVAWVMIALYANRNYTLWIAGTQLLAVTAHIARALADVISPVAYATMVIAPGWAQLLLLGAGLILHVLRRREYGAYRDWRTGRNGRPLPFVARVAGWKAAAAALWPARGGRAER
ncbi:hypothetical protein [Erythrobacter sp. HL-111]|uniref:hypothetical protein n=1 Tax=Erythrobacter sp. HL-111 TaxID=1798193 RepID=UPI0006DADA42|nr:hypothetical protein [Erythrobacter sp. HL-111]KPP89483.1 MAG: hypothetical protein HLUCCO15_10415 [Erythrobacteraceae bacterium HL-111]SDS47400.1 hypothetical protein SAMN04515621_1633 [Erythrobacter sp. HL-111]